MGRMLEFLKPWWGLRIFSSSNLWYTVIYRYISKLCLKIQCINKKTTWNRWIFFSSHPCGPCSWIQHLRHAATLKGRTPTGLGPRWCLSKEWGSGGSVWRSPYKAIKEPPLAKGTLLLDNWNGPTLYMYINDIASGAFADSFICHVSYKLNLGSFS